ncbi:MAG: HK97 gp10 family phage protein [Candidatus Binatia bacterium]
MAKTISVRIEGVDKIMANLKKLGPDAKRAAAYALTREAEELIVEAKKETPVDTGALRNSGHVQPATIAPQRVEVVAGFGGAAAPYAIYVHERTDRKHVVGGAKFLENPFNRRLRGLEDRLVSNLKRFGFLK